MDLDGDDDPNLITPEISVADVHDGPAAVPESAAKDVQAAVEPKGPSLIFGGGGDFLSKYSSMRSDSEAGRARLRKKGGTPVAGAAGKGGDGTLAPDRMHVQLNSMLVHARTADKILQVVDSHFDHFNAVNLITALHRLATLVVPARKGSLRRDVRFKRLIHRLSDTLRNADSNVLKPQDLSNVAWALTKLGLLNATLFGHLSEHILRTITSFEPVNLSMTLWAFARSGFLDEKLFRSAATEVKKQLPDFQPQQIANTTWAMAKSGIVDEELFLSAASLALEKLNEFQPMNFSMLLFSFALAKLPHPKLFDEVGKRCTVQALSSAASAPHIVTNLALAYSEAGESNQNVFNAIATVASSSLYDFRTQQIATLAQAFARAQVPHEQLFAAISQSVVQRLAEFKQHDLQEVLAAYDALGLSTADIAAAIEAQQYQEPDRMMNRWLIIALLAIALFAIWVAWYRVEHRKD